MNEWNELIRNKTKENQSIVQNIADQIKEVFLQVTEQKDKGIKISECIIIQASDVQKMMDDLASDKLQNIKLTKEQELQQKKEKKLKQRLNIL